MTIYPLYVANFLLLVCYTAVLWCICKSNAKLQGMRLLAWAYTAALGSAITATIGTIQEYWLLRTVSATLLLVAFILLHYSFLNFVKRRPQRPWGWIALLSFGFAAFLYCSLDPNRILLRLQINALLVGFQAALSAYVLLRYADKSLKVSARAMALVLVLFAMRSLVRCVWIHHYGVMPESLSGRWAEIAGVSGYLMVNAFTPLGYLWMATTRLQSELESLSSTDSLTGTLNRRAFDEKGRAEVERSRRYQLPMSLLAMDIDHFKSLNDSRGHAGGDRVLITIADAMSGLLRSSDHLARFGGDEFLILLPATDNGGAYELAERLRERIEAIAVEFHGESLEVHASFGVATIAAPLPDQEDKESWEHLQQQADAALYRAKELGRNRVEAADDLVGMV
jgi:diguanylate cyclase (GGDEF)-like protein